MMEFKKTLNVFFAIDKNLIVQFTVTLTSLLENNQDLSISVYVVHDIENNSVLKNAIHFFHTHYNIDINLIKVNKELFDTFPVSDHLTYVTKAAYFRLLLADLIPNTIDQGLYLDCDIIVTDSLAELTNKNIFNNGSEAEFSIMAVADKGESNEIERFKQLNVFLDSYFNSGVMLINFKEWRLKNISSKLFDTVNQYENDLRWLDQDVLNIGLQNKWGKLNNTYNKIVDKKLQNVPIIIHFSGSSKPWHYLNNHPYKFLYWKYLNLTPFKDEKFESVTIKKVFQKYRGKLERSATSISKSFK